MSRTRITVKRSEYILDRELRDRTVEVELVDPPKYATGGRYYAVYLDGVKVGQVHRDERTWERRSRGNRFVNARGTTPAWFVDGAPRWDDHKTRASAAYEAARLAEEAGA